jgi:hypothetical protein
VGLSLIQGRASNLDPAGVADIIGVDHDLERRVRDVLAVALHGHLMKDKVDVLNYFFV